MTSESKTKESNDRVEKFLNTIEDETKHNDCSPLKLGCLAESKIDLSAGDSYSGDVKPQSGIRSCRDAGRTNKTNFIPANVPGCACPLLKDLYSPLVETLYGAALAGPACAFEFEL